MTFLADIPWWLLVVSACAIWLAFTCLVTRFVGFGARFDLEVDEPREEIRDAIVRPLPTRPYRPGTAR